MKYPFAWLCEAQNIYLCHRCAMLFSEMSVFRSRQVFRFLVVQTQRRLPSNFAVTGFIISTMKVAARDSSKSLCIYQGARRHIQKPVILLPPSEPRIRSEERDGENSLTCFMFC